MLRIALAAAASLVVATSAFAATGQGTALARTLKPKIQALYKKNGSDDVFTKVTCTLAPTATVGNCKAYFTSASLREKGWLDITATVNRTTGVATWRATKATCISPTTGKPAAC